MGLRTSLVVGAVGLVALASGCNSNCPSCDGTLYTQPGIFAPLVNAGPGLDNYKTGMPDSHTPVTSCGFVYYDNEKGGVGHTLQQIGCDDDVFLLWANNSLQEIAVTSGWQGQTEKGFRLGDGLTKFRELYPNATLRNLYFPEGNQKAIWTAGHLKVNFNEGKANFMGVYLDNFDSMPDERATPIGPSEWQ